MAAPPHTVSAASSNARNDGKCNGSSSGLRTGVSSDCCGLFDGGAAAPGSVAAHLANLTHAFPHGCKPSTLN
eukprot:360633-Chlamydomonas_euryale.AAC.7